MGTVAKMRYAPALIAFAMFIASAGSADAANFAGRWSVGGSVVGGGYVTTIAPVCVLQQVGARIAGACRGPNNGGAAAGTVSGGVIVWQWRMVALTRLGFSGIATFRGVLGPGGIVRGQWRLTSHPGYVGNFTMKRV